MSSCQLFRPSDLLKIGNSTRFKVKSVVGVGRFSSTILLEDDLKKCDVLAKITTQATEGELLHWPALNHPNLVPMLDKISLGNHLTAVVYPCLDVSLATLMELESFSQHPKCFARKRDYVKDVLAGLEYLHQNSLSLMNLTCHSVVVSIEKNKASIGDYSCITSEKFTRKVSCLEVNAPEVLTCPSESDIECMPVDMWCYGLLCLQVFISKVCPWKSTERIFQSGIDANFLHRMNTGYPLSVNESVQVAQFLLLFLQTNPKLRVCAEDGLRSSFFQFSFKRLDADARHFWSTVDSAFGSKIKKSSKTAFFKKPMNALKEKYFGPKPLVKPLVRKVKSEIFHDCFADAPPNVPSSKSVIFHAKTPANSPEVSKSFVYKGPCKHSNVCNHGQTNARRSQMYKRENLFAEREENPKNSEFMKNVATWTPLIMGNAKSKFCNTAESSRVRYSKSSNGSYFQKIKDPLILINEPQATSTEKPADKPFTCTFNSNTQTDCETNRFVPFQVLENPKYHSAESDTDNQLGSFADFSLRHFDQKDRLFRHVEQPFTSDMLPTKKDLESQVISSKMVDHSDAVYTNSANCNFEDSKSKMGISVTPTAPVIPQPLPNLGSRFKRANIPVRDKVISMSCQQSTGGRPGTPHPYHAPKKYRKFYQALPAGNENDESTHPTVKKGWSYKKRGKKNRNIDEKQKLANQDFVDSGNFGSKKRLHSPPEQEFIYKGMNPKMFSTSGKYIKPKRKNPSHSISDINKHSEHTGKSKISFTIKATVKTPKCMNNALNNAIVDDSTENNKVNADLKPRLLIKIRCKEQPPSSQGIDASKKKSNSKNCTDGKKAKKASQKSKLKNTANQTVSNKVSCSDVNNVYENALLLNEHKTKKQRLFKILCPGSKLETKSTSETFPENIQE